jgi:hypothetical protein
MRIVRLFFNIIVISSFVQTICAQAKNDYNWILGYHPNIPDEYFGGVMLDFNHDIASPEYFNIYCSASEPAILSSNLGKLLVYSEGCRIYNSLHEVMIGGDSINFGETWKSNCYYGYPGIQNKLLLPWPGDTSMAILFHIKIADDLSTSYLLYSTLIINKEYPNGIVTQKNKYLLNPGLTGAITATRHANGRDWWILLPERKSNRFFSILLDNKGVALVDSQTIGSTIVPGEWVSQAVFSPNGNKYVLFKPLKGVEIFDFDRCTGKLSNLFETGLFSDPDNIAGGVAISSDSRFLYVSDNINLYQFDLFSEDILSSLNIIGSYDGYNNPFATTFHQMMLAPDGKIYMFATNGVKSIHVINHPELKGLDCKFIQHGIELPANIFIGSINVPYFRLSSYEGSLCDTLGINNLPIADFRYEIDSLNPLRVHFRNLSYFDPKTFNWTFGNNTSSPIKLPMSVDYESYGIYDVCLQVANEYGTNTFCRTIILNDSITSVNDNFDDCTFIVRPNPFNSELYIIMDKDYSDLTFMLYSVLGSPVYQNSLNKKTNRNNLPELPKGLYFYCIRLKGEIIQTGKLVKAE